jgi:membrane protein DedA with SNARE-associated domain
MATKQSGLIRVYFVALTLLGIECAYRLVYYWLGTAAISAPDAQAAWSHLYVWLPISAVILVLWALAAWRWYQWEAAPKTKKDKDMLSAR